MSQSDELALDLPHGVSKPKSISAPAIDLSVPHRFGFAGQRWFTGAGTVTKGALMITAGVFLLSQIPATPNLVVQMAILSGLLIVGGAAFVLVSLGDFFGSLTIDEQGYRANFVLTGFSGTWSNVVNWVVHESSHNADIPAVQIWTGPQQVIHAIPGGYLSKEEGHRVHQLLRALAPCDECETPTPSAHHL